MPDLQAALERSVEERGRRLEEQFALSTNDVAELLAGLTKANSALRQPPLAAQAVLRTLHKPSYGLNEIIKLIDRDPAMSQALLRHANSVLFAGLSNDPVVGIKPAIQRVGSKGVHAAVMSQFVGGELLRPGPGFDLMARTVWQHMVRVAPVAGELARRWGTSMDDAFTLGLLHDVGKLILFDRMSAERKRHRRDLVLPDGFVSEALKVLHEPLGGWAVQGWGLDNQSAQVIAWHHRTGEYRHDHALSEVVFLAERIDLDQVRGVEPDLDLHWSEGRLTGPQESVAEWLQRARDAA